MKFCPRLLIFEPLDCTLGIFRGYDFSILKILLFLDRYFGVFDSDLRASPPPGSLRGSFWNKLFKLLIVIIEDVSK